MDPVQALAILSLGAFLAGLITAAFYVFTVRPRLLDSVGPTPQTAAMNDRLEASLDDQQALFMQIQTTLKRLDQGFEDQRSVIERLSMASERHTRELSAAADLVSTGSAFDADLRGMLNAQTDAVQSLSILLENQVKRFSQIDARLVKQGESLQRLEQLRFAHQSQTSAELTRIASMIQSQSEHVAALSERVDGLDAASEQASSGVGDAARVHVLGELSNELANQATAIRQLDVRLREHTLLLQTAADERREHGGVLDGLRAQISDVFPQLTRLVGTPIKPGQDRLTDIRGIGPVYSSKLRDAGVETFEKLADMSPEEVLDLIDEPLWRERSIDSASWIEQARERVAQRKKVE